MLLPVVCAVCRSVRDRSGLCPACRAGLIPPPVDAPVPVLIAYEGAGRQLVTALKYRDARRVVPLLADALVALAGTGSSRSPARGRPFDAVVWVPTSPGRRRARGFDQAELLAGAVAVRLGVPARRLLRRVGSVPQTGRTRAQRLHGPTFVVVGQVPSRVLLVDDVVTTGATLSAARSALLAAGVRVVRAVAVAATPQGPVSHHGPSARESGSPARRGGQGGGRSLPVPVAVRDRSEPADTSGVGSTGGAHGCHRELPAHRSVARAT